MPRHRKHLRSLFLIGLLPLLGGCCRAEEHKPGESSSERYTIDGTGLTADELAALLGNRVFVMEFTCLESSLNVDDGALTVMHTPDVHAKVRDFLALLRKPLGPGEMAVSDADAWRSAVETQLAQKRVSVAFAQTPLNEAVAQLSKSTGVAISVDPDIHAPNMPTLDLKLDDVTLESALKWIADAVKLDYCVHAGGILVSKWHCPDLECRIYNIADLKNPPGLELRCLDVEKDLAYWSQPRIGTDIEKLGNCLIVRLGRVGQNQVSQHLADVRKFLEQIRKAEPDGNPPQKPLDPALVPGHSQPDIEAPWRKALRTKLEKRVTFDFNEMPFKDAVDFIRNECHVNLVIDPGALASAEKSPVTLRVTDMSAEQALRFLFTIADVKYELRDEAVFLGMMDMFIDSVELRDFYVRDLTSVFPPSDLEALLADGIYRAAFHPALGTSIEEKNGILTVMLPPYDISKIEALFDQLRLHADDPIFYLTRAAFGLKEPFPDIECAIFNLSDMSAEQTAALAAQFKAKFPDSNGDDEPRFIRAVGKRLIVQNTREARDSIAKMLEELRKAKPAKW